MYTGRHKLKKTLIIDAINVLWAEEHRMKQQKHLSHLAFAILTSISLSSHADIDVYGQLHLSSDRIDDSTIADTTLASNASHLGFKGEHELNYGFKAMWTLESDIDVAGERDWLTARNRFIGLTHPYGTVLAGYHDTPMKTLGSEADLLPETIADRRNVLGSGNGLSSDIRARNSAMYISPTFYGTEWRFLGSVGGDDSPTEDTQYLISTSLTYKHDLGFVGMAAERQMQTELARNHARLIVGGNFAGAQLNLFYEWMDSDTVSAFSRQGYGSSAAYTLRDTSLIMQAFYADNHEGQDNSQGVSFGIGLSQRFSQTFEMYLVYAQTINGANASFALGAGEHGDTYYGENAGDDLMGISGGVRYQF